MGTSCKEQFKEILNPADMSSVEEAELEDPGEALPKSVAEVAEIVKKLLRGKAHGVDEICPEMLKALDTVALLWLTCLLCQCHIDV
ncbi:hypothetical protein L3Q82_019232 [Scortum barcoo]|uniref:Uncharacterized protein n=1 Tax=Scortum barcoo TaxID=214431 RepID=A0ACB8VB98_9TELE|nr:hypothetical protein L3Q82_019232 [Scortum barcoo]